MDRLAWALVLQAFLLFDYGVYISGLLWVFPSYICVRTEFVDLSGYNCRFSGILHGSGMSYAMTASPKPSFRAPWRVGDAVVGRGNAGWTTPKSGHPCPSQNCSQGLSAEMNGRGFLLNRPSCPPPTHSVKGLNWTELNCRYETSFKWVLIYDSVCSSCDPVWLTGCWNPVTKNMYFFFTRFFFFLSSHWRLFLLFF